MDGDHSIKVNSAILHILDNALEVPVLSYRGLDEENGVWEFLEKHISKALKHDALKTAAFINKEENKVFSLVKNLSPEVFVSSSIQLSEILFAIMRKYCEIPSGDMIYCLFQKDNVDYFVAMKFNYKASFVHFVSNSEQGTFNQLIEQKATLPNANQKIDECMFVNLSNLDLKIIEKPYEINGETDFYLSKRFIGCSSDLSNKEKVNILNKTVNKICEKYVGETFKKVSQLHRAISENIEETNEIQVDMIAKSVFKETALRDEYLVEVKKAGLTENVISIPEENNTSKKFKKNKLKTDTGIEINFPSHFYDNKEFIDFINNPDGSISILIKNINKITNK